MSEKHVDKFYDDILCKDVKVLIEILNSISNSYRLLVGAAEEFNRITLVHRHEAEKAIDRADDLGDIIDDVENELNKLMKMYLHELACKIEIQQQYNNPLLVGSAQYIPKEVIDDLENKY